jgi:hypothetical protein
MQAVKDKLHIWIYYLVERLQKEVSTSTTNEANFVKDGKASIHIQLSLLTPEIRNFIASLGFEFEIEAFETINGKKTLVLVGKIPIEKISRIAEINEVMIISPNVK